MAYKSMAARIKDGFDDESISGFGVDYLKLLLERWSEIARALRRTGTLIVVLGAGFALLVGAEAGEVTLGPLKITNLASVLPLVPVVLSFLIYELVVLVNGQAVYARAASALVSRMYPGLRGNQLDALLGPATTALWGYEDWRLLRTGPRGLAGRAVSAFDQAVGIALILGSFFFQGYAFYALYEHPDTNVAVVSIALVVTCFNLLRTYLVVQDEY